MVRPGFWQGLQESARQGQGLCRQIGADVLPDQGAPVACWELSGHKALPTDAASSLGLMLQEAWPCHTAFSEALQVGWTHVPYPDMPVRGASGCAS